MASVMEEMTLAGDWTDRYRLLVEWGERDDPLSEDERRPEFQIPGCSSPLWLRVRWRGHAVEVKGASPGLFPRALVALLVRLFDGLDEVCGACPAVLDSLDLRRHLSLTRGLVLERMLERIRNCARTAP
jgi:cysteine desulfuration protein SufE